MKSRRDFLQCVAASAASAAAGAAPVKIRSITLAPLECRFHKFVAMNSYDVAPKGHTYRNTLIRIATDQGVEGIGVMSSAPDDAYRQALKTLVGANPLSMYEMKDGRITGRAPAYADVLSRYRHLDGPLFDLIGKLTSKPAWQLIGPSVRDRVEVYDGTIYFSDVWFSERGVRAVVEEAEEAMKKGYLGVKLKMGRGWKWMEREAGLRRDIEVTLAVRGAVGPKVKVLVDANNGYRDDHERLWRYISETASANPYWIEEMIPENVAHYTALREKMQKAGFKALIAEGENTEDLKELEPYLKPKRLYDVVQVDIRRAGLVDNIEAARMADTAGAISVPHNWGSYVGTRMGLQFSKAVRNAPAAEDDRGTSDVAIPEGYEFRGGYYTVSDAPGLGLRINEKAYALKCKPGELVIS